MPDSNDAGLGPAHQRPWAADALGWLIGPVGRQAFLEQYYEREPLVVTRDEPGRFLPLLSVAAIDRFIASADLREGMVDLADASRELERSSYLLDNGTIDRAVIAYEYARGATIIPQQLHQSDPNLADFCRAMEHEFSCHVQTNIYLTPPNAQGFRTHFDNHDVFVMQVEGEKRWRFYNTPVDTPYRGEQFRHGEHPTGEITREFVMTAGDVAYVPRGLMHDASTAGDGPSLHVTCGLMVKTWAELVLEAVSEVALTEPAFRRSLPAGHARGDYNRAEAEVVFHKLLAILPAKARLDNAFQLMVDAHIRSREPDIAGSVIAGGKPVPAGPWRLKATAPWRLAEDGDILVLIAPGGDVTFKADEAEAARRAMNGTPFLTAELQTPEPENIVRRLLAFGVIEPG